MTGRGLLLFVLVPVVVLAAVAVLFLALVGGYNLFQRSEQRAAVEASSGPIHLPGPDLLPAASFTAYADWREAFEITYAEGPFLRADRLAVGYQFGPNSTLSAGSEGPRQADIDRLLAVHRRHDCDPVDPALLISLCRPTGDEGSHLVRTVDPTAGIKVVMAYVDDPAGPGAGDPGRYNPDSTEAIVLRSLQPMAIADALERHFHPIT